MRPSFTFSSDDRGWRGFVATSSVCFVALVGIVFLLNTAILWRTGELASPEDLLAHQRLTGGLYRSATSDDLMSPWMKFARYDLVQPEVIALGSSRVMQFRQEHFQGSFLNMGMTVDYVHLPNIAKALLSRPHRLKLVILSVDFWQVHANRAQEVADDAWDPRRRAFEWTPGIPAKENLARLKNMGRNFVGHRVTGPLSQIVAGKTTTLEAMNMVLQRDRSGLPTQNRGTAAMLDGSGVAEDGSYYYDFVFNGVRRPRGFSDVLDRIRNSNNGFESADAVDLRRWQRVEAGLELLRAAGVNVVVIIPAVAPSIAKLMRASRRYGVVEDMAARLRGIPNSFDFHDAAAFGSNDCEFIDGYHGGEVTHLRMLQIMAADHRSGLAEFVDRAKIKERIDRYAGHAVAFSEPKGGDRSRKEGDFLALGCAK